MILTKNTKMLCFIKKKNMSQKNIIREASL